MRSKEEIRKEIIEKRKQLTQAYILLNSKKILDTVLQMKEYLEAKCIYMYMDVSGEVPTRDILLRSLESGKKVAIPRITNNIMEFYYISDIEDVHTGYYGIREPKGDTLAKEKDAFMIMPGVAFDKAKHRIGRGKGFYDKYLNDNNIERKIAIAFDFQVFNEIPYDKYDILPDLVVTEKRIIY